MWYKKGGQVTKPCNHSCENTLYTCKLLYVIQVLIDNFLASADIKVFGCTHYPFIKFSVVEIVQPPSNSHTVTFDESTSCVQLMCSLNINISSNMTVTWMHNGRVSITTTPNEITTTGNTTTLLIIDPQPSDTGDYQCVITDIVNGWTLSRNILLQEIELCKYNIAS